MRVSYELASRRRYVDTFSDKEQKSVKAVSMCHGARLGLFMLMRYPYNDAKMDARLTSQLTPFKPDGRVRGGHEPYTYGRCIFVTSESAYKLGWYKQQAVVTVVDNHFSDPRRWEVLTVGC